MKINTHQCYSPPPGCWTRQRWWTRPGPSLSMQWLSDHSDNMMTRQNCKIDGKYIDSENRGMWLRKVHTSLWFTRPAMHFIPDTKTQLLAIAIGKDRLKAEKMVPTNLVELWPPASQFLGHLDGFYQTLNAWFAMIVGNATIKIARLLSYVSGLRVLSRENDRCYRVTVRIYLFMRRPPWNPREYVCQGEPDHQPSWSNVHRHQKSAWSCRGI